MATEQFTIRLPVELMRAIEHLAKDEMRSKANMVEYILTSWITDNRFTYLEEEMSPLRADASKEKPKKGKPGK
jgi:hypothetical protein